jgi:hypothetical protein
MAKKSKPMSTSEFSSLTGIPVSTVAKLLRLGKIKGSKKTGKWMIDKNEIKVKVVQEMSKRQRLAPTIIESTITDKVQKPTKKSEPKAKKAATQNKKALLRTTVPSVPIKEAGEKAYSVSEFSAMTYLTDFGVTDWLRKGRLHGVKDKTGAWQVDASNLELPIIKRLLR